METEAVEFHYVQLPEKVLHGISCYLLPHFLRKTTSNIIHFTMDLLNSHIVLLKQLNITT